KERTLIVLDNLESVTGEALSIRNSLDESDRNAIKEFLRRLVGGHCFMLFGSRAQVGWLDEGVIEGHVIRLSGLDDEAAGTVAQRIMSRSGITHIRAADGSIAPLLKLLAGHPLALEVVLPHLRTRSPESIIDALSEGLEPIDSPSTKRSESIIECI